MCIRDSHCYLPRVARRLSHRGWYWVFAVFATAITCFTMPLEQPGRLILYSSVVGFVGTVSFSFGLLIWNHAVLPRHLPAYARPGRLALIAMTVSCAAYTVLAVAYARERLGHG